MRVVIGVLLLGHAVAHLPGFLVNLRLRSFPELPFKTTVLSGSVDLGEGGIRMLGIAWLVLATALFVVAIATFIRLPWWHSAAHLTLGLSILMCVLAWPDARLGVLASVVILVMIVFSARAHWL